MNVETLQLELVRRNPITGGWYYTSLRMPAEQYEIQDALEQLRAVDVSDNSLSISVMECSALPELTEVHFDSPTLQEMNFFAERLAAMNNDELIVLRAVAPRIIHPGEDEVVSVKDLINTTYGLDAVSVISNVSTDEQLGAFVIENDLHNDVAAIPEGSLYLLDKGRIGELQRKNDGGVFAGNRYVVAGEYEMPEVYDGVTLPESNPESDFIFHLRVKQAVQGTAGDSQQPIIELFLPMEQEEIRHIIDESNSNDFQQVGCKSSIPQIDSDILQSGCTFGMLNNLAKKIAAFSPQEKVVFKAALSAEQPQTLDGVQDVADHISQYELAATLDDAGAFFKSYLVRHLTAGFDPKWLMGMDAMGLGVKLIDRIGASATPYGIISARGRSLYELVSFDGPQNRELTTQSLTDEKLEVVEVLGQTALFTNGRVTKKELPDGLYSYDLREGDSMAFATIEPKVVVNHAGTIITKEPIIFGEEGYIAFNDDTSPNFLGEEMSVREFLDADFMQAEDTEEQQMGGMQL